MPKFREVLGEILHGDRRLAPTIRSSIKRLRSIPPRGMRCGANVRIERPAVIKCPWLVSVGNNTTIGYDCYIAPTQSYAGESFSPQITIGQNVYIGPSLFLVSIGHVKIGDQCVLSNHVYISDAVHGIDPEAGFIMEQPLSHKGDIELGEGCFVGYRSAILPGVKLGNHCVVGIGSIVTRSFPAYSMIAGSPARLIRSYSFQKKAWILATRDELE